MQRSITTNLELIVLKLLNQQKCHGYGILRRIYDNFGVWLSPGTLYPVLNKLEKEGKIRAIEKAEGKKEAKFYEITTEGQTHLRLLIKEHHRFLKCLKNFGGG